MHSRASEGGATQHLRVSKNGDFRYVAREVHGKLRVEVRVASRAWPREGLYPAVGCLLALGAPAGLLVLRCVLAGQLSVRQVASELTRDGTTYAYVTTSTLIVFVLVGLILGRSADRLRASARTDPLTGLANRRYFDERVRVELERERRYGSELSLLLIDVDHLKEINDAQGHEAGDGALRRVSNALTASCRMTDLPARWGGDEFTVLAPGIGADEAQALARRIRETLRRIATPGSEPTTISIGIADASRLSGHEPEDLYAAADSALYEAKSAGRDRAQVYHGASHFPSMRQAT